MASDQQQQQQLRRDENKGGEDREVLVEKDIDPKMTIHFESLAKDSGIAGDQSRGVRVGIGEEEQHERERTQLGKDKNQTPFPIEEISKLRATAQQKSMEAIHAAEEKAANAAVQVGIDEGERGTGEEQERETQWGEGRGERGTTGETQFEGKDKEEEGDQGKKNKDQTLSLEEISKLRGVAQQKSTEAIRIAEEKVANAAAKAKATSPSTLQKVKETAAPALSSAAEKGAQAKDTIVHGAKATTQYVAEKGGEKAQQTCVVAKDTLASAGKVTMDYTVKAKDVSLETGKGAAAYAGKVAADVKDKAVVAGWGAAHLTAEAAVEGTKMAVRAVEGVAGYAGETVMSVGHKVVEVGGKQVEKVRDTAAATGESVKEYTARKQEEAKRDLEAKKSHEQEVEQKGQGMIEKVEQCVGGGEGEKGREEGQVTRQEGQQEGDTGVLGAIGETVVEIAQTAKGLVIGEVQTGEEAGYKGSTMQQTKQGERAQAGSG